MISPRMESATRVRLEPLKAYKVNFYLNGYRIVKDPIMVEADTSENAEAVIKVLLETAHNGIPDKFDDWCLVRC